MTKSRYLNDNYHDSSWFEPGGWQELTLVAVALKQDLFKRLAAGPTTPTHAAEDLGLNARATGLVLEALAALGYLSVDDGRYELTDTAAQRFADPDADSYHGWAVLHSWRLVERWLTLPEVIKTGKPVPGDRFSEGVEGFIRAMDVYARATAEEVADACLIRAPGAGSILDIGGATGTVSKVMAGRGLEATLFDLPDAVDVVKDELARDFPAVMPVGGDFNERLPGGPFDIAFLGNITHIYGPEKIKALFARVAATLNPGGLIAILDFVRGRSASAALFGINMLVNTSSGGTWTEVEYSAWLGEAGFVDIEICDLADRDQQLILGIKGTPTKFR